MLWAESSLPRVRSCGLHLVAGNTAGVALRVSTSSSGQRVAGFGGLQSCGSPWACPVCASKIAAERQGELAAALSTWSAAGRGVVMVTLTMRHDRGQSLRSLWDAQAYAWHAATSGRAWTADQQALGVVMPRTIRTGARAGEVVEEVRVPTVRVVEVTHGDAGWHVHVHALLWLARPVSDATADELGQRLFGRWSAALVRKGLRAPLLRSGGMEAHAGQGDLSDFGDYFTKAQYAGSESLAAEMVRADGKAARRQNRTPFQVAADVVALGLVDDLAIWHEWERGSRGRRQIQWSPGLRELVGLLHAERTDEEIAADDLAGETVAWIEAEDWARRIACVPGRPAALLAALELDTLEPALELLTSWGVWALWRSRAPG